MPGAKFTNQQIFVRLSILAVFVASGLTALTIAWKRTPIETHLAQQARKALAEADLPLVNVHFSGRDGILSGLLSDHTAIDAMNRAVSNVPGVRHVESRLVIPSQEETSSQAQTKPSINGLYSSGNTPENTPAAIPLEQLDLSSINFVYTQSILMESSFPTLDQLAELLRQYPQTIIEIAAHTDNQGTALGQMAATQARAEAILQYLLDKGIPIERLNAKGYGATRPIANHADEAGKARNRRIEITVLKESP